MQARWRWYFALAAVEAAAAVVALGAVPRESTAFSLARLGLLALLAGLALASIGLTLWPSLIPTVFQRTFVLYVFAAGSLVAGIGLFLLRYLRPDILLPYYRRLGIPLWLMAVLAFQGLAWGLVVDLGPRFGAVRYLKQFVKPALVAWAALIAVLVVVSLTRLGLTPDPAYWGEPGVPIMGWQLALSLLAGLVALHITITLPRSSRLDPWICISLWLAASILWLSVPLSVMRNSFYAPIDPPAFQPYPNSDAGYYDSMAESVLVGYPYQGQIPSRPLYIALLTLLHLIVGERYPLIIAGQTFVLALIPVALYVIGRSLHSRSAGVVAAAIGIFRELTSLLVSSQTRVSNTKTLLVDLPTLLLMLVACLAAMRWIRRQDARSALIAGGAFGSLLLLRTQAAAILALLFPLSLIAYARFGRRWMRAALMFLGGTLLVVAPWLVHNYVANGQLALDAPFQYQIIASQYRYTGNLDINSIHLEGKSLAGIVLAFAVRDPLFVLGFVSNHLLATQIGGLLVLPLLEPFSGFSDPINLYWLSWSGHPGTANLALMVVYLAIIAVGLGTAWRRFRWVGMVPLAFSLGYSLANGLGRFSGWRYDLPADWVAYLYFALGVAEVFIAVAALFGGRTEQLVTPARGMTAARSYRLPVAVPALMFVLVGLVPWLAQGVSRPRYVADTASRLLDTMAASRAVQDLNLHHAELAAQAAQPGAVFQIGRVLYPRYFSRDLGLASAHPWPAYAPRGFPRLGFILLTEERQDVVLPLRGAPVNFRNAADAIVLGCQRTDFIEARLVFFPENGLAFPAPDLGAACE